VRVKGANEIRPEF